MISKHLFGLIVMVVKSYLDKGDICENACLVSLNAHGRFGLFLLVMNAPIEKNKNPECFLLRKWRNILKVLKV